MQPGCSVPLGWEPVADASTGWYATLHPEEEGPGRAGRSGSVRPCMMAAVPLPGAP
jgi:hypothetical protein